MLEMFAYVIGVMYTPGPMNLIGLNNGLQRQTRSHMGFYVGVGMAMMLLFSVISLLGAAILDARWMPYMAMAGCTYILYIAFKLLTAEVTLDGELSQGHLSFRDGFIMQLLNPKAPVAVLPVATIQFPALGIDGGVAIVWSVVFGVLAFGAPASYSISGLLLGKKIRHPFWFRRFNRVMAALLVMVAFSIGYETIYQPLLV